MQCIFVQFYRKRKLSVKLMTTKTSLINDVTLYFHRAYLLVSQGNNMDNKVIILLTVSCMILISIRRLEQSAAFREVFCAAVVWKFLVFVQLVRRRFRSIALHPSVSSFLSARVRSRSHRGPRPDLLITLHGLCVRARACKRSPNWAACWWIYFGVRIKGSCQRESH